MLGRPTQLSNCSSAASCELSYRLTFLAMTSSLGIGLTEVAGADAEAAADMV
jgi:hypothetical protein